MPNEEGYPTGEELKKIREWPVTDAPSLVEFIQGLWSYPDRVVIDKAKHELYLSTGGWSGNESIIEALQDNTMFWWSFWQRSQRGGHYWFDEGIVDGKTLQLVRREKA
jgi:hypothetical protein